MPQKDSIFDPFLNKNKSNISGIKKYRLTLKIKTACVFTASWSYSFH